MISDKTAELLTKLRMLCEEVVVEQGEGGFGRPENWSAAAGFAKSLTDIMDSLMTANGIEQRALMAQKCDQDPADMLNIVNKETVN